MQVDLDYAQLATASVAELQESVSVKLGEFVGAQRGGRAGLPEPFPASEWHRVFLTALSTDARYRSTCGGYGSGDACRAYADHRRERL